ncbi:cytosol aminopeptidase-like [Cimex lectularius]|uniref:Cytosol aminopeptidase n=1 Tax=Cimex lectularius TaxID=79782 RepID=A0A8I6TEZ7_CIMLE|nr:cytosol aminopeptidase-like [Cimex lectularius]
MFRLLNKLKFHRVKVPCLPTPFTRQPVRYNMCGGGMIEDTGLILGCYCDYHFPKAIELTETSKLFNIEIEGRLSEALKATGPTPKEGEYRIIYNLHPLYSAIAVVGLGEGCYTYNDMEEMDEYKEVVRIASSVGARALQEIRVRTVHTESFNTAESAAEGTSMGVWMFQELKNPNKHQTIPRLELYGSCDYTGWQIGLQKGAAQNLARQLAETPPNIMTPIGFAQGAVDILTKAGISVEVKVKQWAKIMDMNAYLASASGSCEPPVFLELSYYGCEADVPPLILIGKGVTFNSGGLCLKQCEDMGVMRGDMSGAAIVVGAMRAASALNLPLNIRGLIPLLENMPGNCALKAGDIVRAKNGKTILVEDTDFDARLALADTMSYAGNYNPKAIVDIGTTSSNTIHGLGRGATIGFSNNDIMFESMRISGMHTGDRVWRFPLWKFYQYKLQNPFADTADTWVSRNYSDPCAAAAFLGEFLPLGTDWIHLDIFGTFTTDNEIPYLRKGMSGRPVRTIVEFLAQQACQHNEAEVQATGGGHMTLSCAGGESESKKK